MKTKYKKPELKIHKFETNDVISTSCSIGHDNIKHYSMGANIDSAINPIYYAGNELTGGGWIIGDSHFDDGVEYWRYDKTTPT